MELGKFNLLTILRASEPGLYLVDDNDDEVLLPNAYVTEEMKIGDELDVFLYKDSDDRLVATTLTPYVQLEEFAFLKVKEVNRFGAFLDWGLPKDLLVPFAEQLIKMEEGKSYLIFLIVDEESQRLIGSAKVNEFVYTDKIELKPGEKVDLLLYKMTDLGMHAIVNNNYHGLIFHSDLHKKIYPGDKISAYVKQVREDGKIDLSLNPIGFTNSIDKFSQIIIDTLNENSGFMNLTDKTSPEIIKEMLGMSKKAFKNAIGNLYKQKLIEISDEGIKLKK